MPSVAFHAFSVGLDSGQPLLVGTDPLLVGPFFYSTAKALRGHSVSSVLVCVLMVQAEGICESSYDT